MIFVLPSPCCTVTSFLTFAFLYSHNMLLNIYTFAPVASFAYSVFSIPMNFQTFIYH